MSRFEEQAGLEVVEIPSGLEHVNHVVVKSSDAIDAGEKIAADEAHEPTPQKSRKRRILWIGVAVAAAVVVIVAAVVGGVVGSRASKSHHNSPTASNDAQPIIRDNSTLAVTGWRLGGKTNVQLFWQGKDDFVYYSAWDSGHDSWNAPVKLTIGAVPDTPMAAGVIFQLPAQAGGPPDPQVQFFYQNTTGYLNGENFRSSFPNGLPDSINNGGHSFQMEIDSTLAAYWPTIVYESPGLEAVWYASGGYSSKPESLSSESAIASAKTPIAVLPLQRVPSANLTVKSDLKLLYRRDDGYLYELDQWSNGTFTNGKLNGFEVASNATLAAFAIARDNTTALLNTYLIYQAADGRIMYGANTNSTWDGPRTDSVFDGADIPTNLACVTAAADSVRPLTSATDLNKCYFQRKGELVEVLYDGSKWSKVGTVSIS